MRPLPRAFPPGLDSGQSSVPARYIPGTPEAHGKRIPQKLLDSGQPVSRVASIVGVSRATV